MEDDTKTTGANPVKIRPLQFMHIDAVEITNCEPLHDIEETAAI